MKKTNAIRLLEQAKIPYDPIHYQYEVDNLSVEKIAEENGLQLEVIYKTLVAKGDKTGVVVAVIPGDQTMDFKALAKVSGNKKTAMVAVKEIQGLTGYVRGGCSPIGMKKDFPVFIDQKATDYQKIYVNAGVRGLLIGVKPEELRSISNGMFAKISS